MNLTIEKENNVGVAYVQATTMYVWAVTIFKVVDASFATYMISKSRFFLKS
jgi:hypothetical protein